MNPPWQSVLEEHFNILGMFHLGQSSRNMSQLYKQLAKIKKPEFHARDRIVFMLFDHDFYLDNTGPGWTLYNLQMILSDLDIPNYFCLLLTKMPDYDDLTQVVQKNLTNDHFPIRSMTTLLNLDFFPTDGTVLCPRQPRIEQIDRAYCLLSRQSRPYRTFFMSKLWSENLLEHGIIGYNNLPAARITSNNNAGFEDQPVGLSLLEIPSSWQKVLLRRESNRNIFFQFDQQFRAYKNFAESVDLSDKIQSCSPNSLTPINQALLYVALETEVEIPKVFISRISLRGILERRPFVIFGCPGTLRFIRSRGFKTFSEFWDESYDDMPSFEDRVDGILQVIRQLSTLDRNQLLELYKAMQPILDHNHDFYFNHLLATEQQKLHEQCRKNLNHSTHDR